VTMCTRKSATLQFISPKESPCGITQPQSWAGKFPEIPPRILVNPPVLIYANLTGCPGSILHHTRSAALFPRRVASCGPSAGSPFSGRPAPTCNSFQIILGLRHRHAHGPAYFFLTLLRKIASLPEIPSASKAHSLAFIRKAMW